MKKGLNVSADHALVFDGPVTNIHEAPAIGNGDLGGLVQVFHDEFRLHLGKNDIWDARFDAVAKDGMVTQDDLIRLSKEYGFYLKDHAYSGKAVYDHTPPKNLRYTDHHPGWDSHVFPCPKPAGQIRILHSGISSTRIHTVVDIRNGEVTSTFEMDFGWHGTGLLRIEAFVEREANVVRMRISQERMPGAIRICVEKLPDSIDATLPLPQVRLGRGATGTVTQQIPSEYGAKAFAWHLAGAFPQAGRGIKPVEAHPFRLWQSCELQPGSTLEFSVGIATDRDGRKPSRRRALQLSTDARAQGYAAGLKVQNTAWAAFWERSGITLSDKDLENAWYRDLFALACQIRPGAMAPGLVGNVVPWDASHWHGCYTVNMNTQKMFLASIPSNHPEWIDCYADWLDHMRHGFRHLAEITFGLKGIHSPHMIFPYQPPERQASSNQCGRALGMTGWHGQPLWWRWEYFRDREFLEKRAYPYFKEAACFYWRYLKKYLDETGDLYPSLNLEGPPWTKDFEHNRDPFIDLILFRNTFLYAIKAAEVLDKDAAWRKRWAWGLERIRPVRVEPLANGGWWIYSDKNSTHQDRLPLPNVVKAGQCVTAAWTVFPGEMVAGDELDGLAPALRQIMQDNQWSKWHPAVTWIHHWWCAIPALRMQLPDAFEVARSIILKERFPAGHARTTHWIHLTPDAWRVPEDNYLGVSATTEMLLQSQGGAIRLFPCWPRKRKAAFRRLPARGGFIVSASFDPKCGIKAEIESLSGELCRIRWNVKNQPKVHCNRASVSVKHDGRDIVFATRIGERYQLDEHSTVSVPDQRSSFQGTLS